VTVVQLPPGGVPRRRTANAPAPPSHETDPSPDGASHPCDSPPRPTNPPRRPVRPGSQPRRPRGVCWRGNRSRRRRRALPDRRSIGEPHDPQSGPTVTVRNPRLRTAVVIDQHTSPVGMTAGSQFVVDVESECDAGPGLSHRFGALTEGTPADGTSAPLRPAFHAAERGRPVGVPVAVDPADAAGVGSGPTEVGGVGAPRGDRRLAGDGRAVRRRGRFGGRRD